MYKIGIVIGSTRPGRKGEIVGKWVHDLAVKRGDADYSLLDVKEQNLPLLDEPVPAGFAKEYTKEHTKRWSALIGALDGFVFVTPEYNHGLCPALKNALDFLYREWNFKPAGFVGYGGMGAARSIEQLRLVMGALKVYDVYSAVSLSYASDYVNDELFRPAPHQDKAVGKVLGEVVALAGPLQAFRMQAGERAA